MPGGVEGRCFRDGQPVEAATSRHIVKHCAMTISPRQFVRFMDGRGDREVVVGFVPGALTAHLRSLETDLRLRRDYAIKLAKRKLYLDGYEKIQQTIDKGVCSLVGPHHISFLWIEDRARPIVWFLLIKTNKLRNELWLVTFHRVRMKQLLRQTTTLPVLREHEEEFDG